MSLMILYFLKALNFTEHFTELSTHKSIAFSNQFYEKPFLHQYSCKSCPVERIINMSKAVKRATQAAMEGNAWKKFVDPTVNRGKTVFPKGQADQERLGVRWDYDGEVTKSDGIYHIYQMQPNGGKVPSSIEEWKRKYGGTHTVMATALVKKGGTKDDVKQGLEKAANDVKA